MLTKLIVRNFKKFEDAEIELGNPVVFIGPNNSGKTTALQALSLWQTGLVALVQRRKGAELPGKRPGVTINRRALLATPVPHTNLLWRNSTVRTGRKGSGGPNVLFSIVVEGVTSGRSWNCGLEFDYSNPESLLCRPLRVTKAAGTGKVELSEDAKAVEMAFLPPMSGLSSREDRLESGSINSRIGEGRTAEVLRNLCHGLHEKNPAAWQVLVSQIQSLFSIDLEAPEFVRETGEITLGYRERNARLDLSCAGRGLHQTLLLLSYMYSRPNAVLLLDEPDAHLEILRQRQIYDLLSEVARKNGNQVIAASHSEVLLNEAAGRDVVVAFVGRPHRINDQGSQVQKALKEIGYEYYYLAEVRGWALYLEGSTDLAILRSFADRLGHAAAKKALERPLVHYVGDSDGQVKKHFYGVREAVPQLIGLALFDRRPKGLPENLGAEGVTWKRREIENYLCTPETLAAFARAGAEAESSGPLFGAPEADRRERIMRESIEEVEKALKALRKGSPWDPDTKVSDDFLTPLFETYFEKLELPNIMAKKNFHELARFVPINQLDPEVRKVLDAIVRVESDAKPVL